MGSDGYKGHTSLTWTHPVLYLYPVIIPALLMFFSDHLPLCIPLQAYFGVEQR